MKNKLIFNIILSITVFIATLFVVYLVSLEKTQVFQKRAELLALNRDLGQLDQILVDRKKETPNVASIKQTIPQTYQQFSYALAQTERLAKNYDQNLTTEVKEQTTSEKNPQSSISLNQKTIGLYYNYTNFLSSLAKLPYHTSVNSLEISKEGDNISTSVNYLFQIGDKIQ